MTRPDLREFARVVLNEFWVPGIFSDDIDGGTLQDIAERHGLLIPRHVTESCGDNCNCDDFPGTCYRVHELLAGDAEKTEQIMLDQKSINALARALGITPEACPWAWEEAHDQLYRLECCPMDGPCLNCVLPDPTSDDPGVWVWDGFLLRARGGRGVRNHPDGFYADGTSYIDGVYATTTAALLAAWQGREKA